MKYNLEWTTYGTGKVQLAVPGQRPRNIKPLREWELLEFSAINDSAALAKLVKHVKSITGLALPFASIKGRSNIMYCRNYNADNL